MNTAPYPDFYTLSPSTTLTAMVDHCNLQPSSPSSSSSIHTPYEFPPSSSSEICPRDLEVIQDVDEEHLDEDPDHTSLHSQHPTTPAQPIPASSSRRFSRRLSYHQYQYHSTPSNGNTCPSTPALSSSPPMLGMFSSSSSVTSSPGGNYSMPMSPSLVGVQCQFCGGAGMTGPLVGHTGHCSSGSGQWTSDLRQYIMTDIGPQPSNSQVPTLRSGSHLVRQRSSSKISPAAATMPLANGGMVCPECGGCGQQSADGVVPYGGGYGSFYGRYASVTDLCTIPQDEILPPMKMPFENRRRFVGHDEWDDDE